MLPSTCAPLTAAQGGSYRGCRQSQLPSILRHAPLLRLHTPNSQLAVIDGRLVLSKLCRRLAHADQVRECLY